MHSSTPTSTGVSSSACAETDTIHLQAHHTPQLTRTHSPTLPSTGVNSSSRTETDTIHLHKHQKPLLMPKHMGTDMLSLSSFDARLAAPTCICMTAPRLTQPRHYAAPPTSACSDMPDTPSTPKKPARDLAPDSRPSPQN